jgi:hypothetical protein
MKNNFSKYIMLVIGFAILFVNAIGYICGSDIKHPALTVMGLVFVTIGMKIVRKK